MTTLTKARSMTRGGIPNQYKPPAKGGFFKAISSHLPCGKPYGEILDTYYPPREKAWVEKAAMTETSGILGGYLAPTEFNYSLLSSIAENSFIEPRACVVPMGSLETLCPKPNYETAQTAGTTPFFGGFKFTWNQAAQGSNINDPTPTAPFKQLSLVAKDLIGEIELSNQFMMDLGEEGEAALLEWIARAAAWHKEYAFLRGLGAGNLQPQGIVTSPATTFVARAGSSAIAIADIAKMSGALIPYSWNHSIWACSPSCLPQIAKVTGYVPNMDPLSTEMGCAGSLMTRPLFVTEKLPPLGTAGDILLFDPSLYVIGNRQEIFITSSPSPSFPTNMTWLKVWLRCDGKPLNSGTITLADATTVASPFVGLAA